MSNNPTNWRKSTRSIHSATCVEVGRTFEGAAVRDTKDHAGGYLTASDDQWRLFLAAIKGDRFS